MTDRPDPSARPRLQFTPPKRAKNRTRFVALLALLAGFLVPAVIVLGAGGGSRSHSSSITSVSTQTSTHSSGATPSGTQSVPILAYNVINTQPSSSTAPASLYVPVDEFTAQMRALQAAGWHAVTLDQVEAYWGHGASLGTAKPIVITFDGGYASQYTNALPVLKNLGWPAVVDLPPNVLPTSDGGIATKQVSALLAAGWQLGDEGAAQPDLTTLAAGQVGTELTTERQTLMSQYGITPRWFAYPSGHYNAVVSSAVRASGFAGGLTSATGWAAPQGNRFLLPRLEVVGGTSPSQLLSQITAAQSTTSAPAAA